jgi:gas vesicle protein
MQNNQGTQKTRSRRQKVMSDDCGDVRVDIGVLKTQVSNITTLCDKMDKVIDKLLDNHDRMVNQIYDDMDRRKEDTTADIKELHSRITTVDRNLSDKIESTQKTLMDEIKNLRNDIAKHNAKEDSEIEKILQWKWMAAGGIIVLSWLLSHMHFAIIEKMLN